MLCSVINVLTRPAKVQHCPVSQHLEAAGKGRTCSSTLLMTSGFTSIMPAMVAASGPSCSVSCKNGFNTAWPSSSITRKLAPSSAFTWLAGSSSSFCSQFGLP